MGNSPLAKPLKTGASSPSPSSLAAGTATSTASSTPTSDPVDLNLDQVLGEMPKKRFDLENAKNEISVPFSLPPDASLKSALDRVLRLPAVASKRFLTNKVDRSVTGDKLFCSHCVIYINLNLKIHVFFPSFVS